MACRPVSNGMWVATWPVLLALGWSCCGCGHIASGSVMAIVGLQDAYAKRLEHSQCISVLRHSTCSIYEPPPPPTNKHNQHCCPDMPVCLDIPCCIPSSAWFGILSPSSMIHISNSRLSRPCLQSAGWQSDLQIMEFSSLCTCISLHLIAAKITSARIISCDNN